MKIRSLSFVLMVVLFLLNHTVSAQFVETKYPVLVHKNYLNNLSQLLNRGSSVLLEHEVNDGFLYLKLNQVQIKYLDEKNILFERLKYFNSADSLPDLNEVASPFINVPTYSGDLTVNSEITIYMEGENQGTSVSDDGYLSMSLPDFTNVISYGKNFAMDNVTKFISGQQIWTCYGNQISAQYVLIDGFEAGWSAGESHEIWAKVKPTQAMTLDIYGKMTIGSIRYPASSTCTGPDQQAWKVKQWTLTIESQVPDMIVEDIWTEPAAPLTGQSTTLYAKIKNIGNATANNIRLNYYINGVYVTYDTHLSLAPQSTQTESESYTFNNSGTHTYKVVVEPVNGEITTNNNDRSETITVTNQLKV